MLRAREAALRLLELGPRALLGIEEEGNVLTLRVADGGEERCISLIVQAHDLTLPVRKESLPPPVELSEEEAQERGLPLYRVQEWLLRMIAEHVTLEAVAQESGYSLEVLEHYADAHGIGNVLHEVIRLRWETGEYRRQKHLAAELGVSPVVVSSIVGRARDEELDARIRELLAKGLNGPEIVAALQREGSRKAPSRLLRLIATTKTRRQREPEKVGASDSRMSNTARLSEYGQAG